MKLLEEFLRRAEMVEGLRRGRLMKRDKREGVFALAAACNLLEFRIEMTKIA